MKRFSPTLELPIVLTALVLFLMPSSAWSRGGGGHFGGGGLGERMGGEDRLSDDERTFNDDGTINRDNDFSYETREDKTDNLNVDRQSDGQTNLKFQGQDGKSGEAQVNNYGDGVANVNVRDSDGKNYDATVVGPDGFRSGYIWRGGGYVPVNIDPLVAYAVPFGAFAGWSIITQPAYIQYPCYATYPVETAVEVALQQLGFYEGEIDGLAASVQTAISTYQSQNGMAPTGTITPELLASLNIQVTQE